MPLTAVLLLSAAALSYEVLLTRLLAIIHWHHFAYMVISLALLGYGASGTYLALARGRLAQRPNHYFALHAALFAVTSVAGFELAQRVPFNALAVFWEPMQLVWLALLYLIFVVPFFFAAAGIGIALAWLPARTEQVYRQDLIGAGLGACLAILGLFILSPKLMLYLSAAFALLAMAAIGGFNVKRMRLFGWFGLAGVVAVLVLPTVFSPLRMSEFKGLSLTLLRPDARVLSEHSSPAGLVNVVTSDKVPFRHAPALSLQARGDVPPQLGVFTDGQDMSAITRFEGGLEAFSYLDGSTAALPYHLLSDPSVLILGVGGGGEVLRALYHRAKRIDAGEVNADKVELLRTTYRDYSGGLDDLPGVSIHAASARSFVARRGHAYDLIHLSHVDAPTAGSALSTNYTYTLEGMHAYLKRLAPCGYLAVTRPLKLPPRDSLKLIATLRAALEQAGAGYPARHVALVRSWGSTTILAKASPLTPPDILAIKRFASARGFDLGYYPGMRSEEGNRFNLLDDPVFFTGARAVLGINAEAFVDRYAFDIEPARDGRPYFFDFFKWQGAREILDISRAGGAVLLDWGTVILVATLLQAVVLSLLLILLPLLFHGRRAKRSGRRTHLLGYFGLIGIAFLLMEIAVMQHFILLLEQPIYAVAVVLAGFLIFAGVGSGLTPRLAAYFENKRIMALDLAVLTIGAGGIIHILIVPALIPALLASPLWLKAVASILLIAPLALPMGVPFPLVLHRLKSTAPEFVPWAWGINGTASVISAVLAMILAIVFGFATVITAAVACYLLAALIGRRMFKGEPEGTAV